jgi:hypothetical protein
MGGVIPLKLEASLADGTLDERSQPCGFWHRLSTAIDSLAAYPVQHALSEREKRLVDDEIARCRELMFARPRSRRAAIRCRAPARAAVAAVKVRP